MNTHRFVLGLVVSTSKLPFTSIGIQLTAWSNPLPSITAYPSEVKESTFVAQDFVIPI